MVEVVTLDEVVKLVDGDTTLAIAGMTVVLSTRPATRKPSDPIMTERRGARFAARLGSPGLFCPCVKFNMHQLSETHSTMLPTTAQHPLNSVSPFDSLTNAQICDGEAKQRVAADLRNCTTIFSRANCDRARARRECAKPSHVHQRVALQCACCAHTLHCVFVVFVGERRRCPLRRCQDRRVRAPDQVGSAIFVRSATDD